MKRGKRITDCIAGAMAAVFLVSACMVDSGTWIPTTVCAVSEVVLVVMQRLDKCEMNGVSDSGQNN